MGKPSISVLSLISPPDQCAEEKWRQDFGRASSPDEPGAWATGDSSGRAGSVPV